MEYVKLGNTVSFFFKPCGTLTLFFAAYNACTVAILSKIA